MARPAFATSVLLALGVVGAPLTAYGAVQPTSRSSDYYTKKVCRTVTPTGSRLGGTRRCRSQAELDAEQEESRKVTTRVQTLRPSMCPPPPQDC